MAHIDILKLSAFTTISVECLPEDATIRGNVSATSDVAADRAAEDRVTKALESGNPWSWCTVKVIATYRDMNAASLQGCCSYESERDFRNDQTFTDMTNEAIERLFEVIKAREYHIPSEIVARPRKRTAKRTGRK